MLIPQLISESPMLRETLSSESGSFIDSLLSDIKKVKVKAKKKWKFKGGSFNHVLLSNSIEANKAQPNLLRLNLRKETDRVIDQYLSNGDSGAISAHISSHIRHGHRAEVEAKRSCSGLLRGL